MVKKLPLFTTVIAGALGLATMAQCPGADEVSIFFSDFETDNGGLVALAGGDWEYGTIPEIIAGSSCEYSFNSPGGAHSGTKGWGTILNDCYNNLGAFSILELTVDLDDPDYVSAKLDFAQWFQVFTSFDYLTITANGTQIYMNNTQENSNTWLEASVDLTPYIGQAAVTLSFKLFATTVVNSSGWYLDDMSVTACTSSMQSIADGATINFRAWPVPAADMLQVEPSTAMGAVQAWTLYDATGRVLTQGFPAGTDRFSIDVSAYHGVGILELLTTNGAYRQQIVMQ